MKGDFSKFSFDPKKHFSGVRMQQGRVQLDADWNEQMDILDSRQQTDVRNLIGSSGAPSDAAGFEITVTGGNTINISAGSYYVDGILAKLETSATYTTQPDYPNPPLYTAIASYLVYLDVWQRHITYIEDPSIREKALNGVDTCTRLKTVAQVKLLQLDVIPTPKPNDTFTQWTNLVSPPSVCRLTPFVAEDANFQNHSYRIEIHAIDANKFPTTFKWSRDNAAYGAVISKIEGEYITLSTEVPFLTFAIDQWVEVSKDELELKGEAGYFGQIKEIQGNKLRVDWETMPPDPQDYKLLRRWDSSLIAITTFFSGDPLQLDASTISIENGLKVVFGSGVCNVGDYWLIPTRANNNDIEWPLTGVNPSSLPPHGIKHHYARLGLVEKDMGGTWNTVGTAIGSERTIFANLNNLSSKLSFMIGIEAMYGSITNPAEVVQFESGSSNFRAYAFDGAGTTSEHVHFCLPLPNNFARYLVSFRVFWHASGSGTVSWNLAVAQRENGSSQNTFSTASSVLGTSTSTGTRILYITEETPIPLTSSPLLSSPNKELEFRFSRAPNADTLTQDAYLSNIQIFLTPL